MEIVSDTEYISKDAFVEQQRKQYCENCERRKGTKNGKRIFVYEVGETPCRACDIEDMIDAVWDFPPADVAPAVHGHWIHLGGGLAKCSVCKWIVKDCYDQYNEDLFCRKCGSKMEESEGKNVETI